MNLAEQNKTIIERLHKKIAREGLPAQMEFRAETSLNHGFPATREVVQAILEDMARPSLTRSSRR